MKSLTEETLNQFKSKITKTMVSITHDAVQKLRKEVAAMRVLKKLRIAKKKWLEAKTIDTKGNEVIITQKRTIFQVKYYCSVCEMY